MFEIYNKSSEKMVEIKNSSIDLIITSPPFNLGTDYNDFKDNFSNEEYFKKLKMIFKECFRVLNKKGILIVEVSDSIFTNGEYIELAGFIQSFCLNLGFSLKERNFNFALTKDYVELPDHGWNQNYTTKINAHSNLNQILVFSKSKVNFNPESKTTYSNYTSSKNHPCPFPKHHIDTFLNKYFKKGFNVLDPFMGTGELGEEVLKRKGNFFGYDVVKKYCEIAQSNLSRL